MTALASKQGFLEENADAGLWQTEEEKEAKEKTQETILLFIDREQFCLPLPVFEHALKHAEKS